MSIRHSKLVSLAFLLLSFPFMSMTYAPVQNQKAVTVYFSSNQLLPFRSIGLMSTRLAAHNILYNFDVGLTSTYVEMLYTNFAFAGLLHFSSVMLEFYVVLFLLLKYPDPHANHPHISRSDHNIRITDITMDCASESCVLVQKLDIHMLY